MRRRALLAAAGTSLVAGCSTRLTGRPDDGTETGTTPTDDAENQNRAARTDAPSPTTAAATPTLTASVEVVERELTRRGAGTDSELVSVAGTLRNVGPPTALTLVAEFYDDEGASVGTGRAELDALGGGASWAFQIVFPGTGDAAAAVAECRLSVETAPVDA